MMLGFYLLARFIALGIVSMLVVFMLILYVVWLLLEAIGRALLDPTTWRPRQPQRPRVPPGKPRNERLYYSDRR